MGLSHLPYLLSACGGQGAGPVFCLAAWQTLLLLRGLQPEAQILLGRVQAGRDLQGLLHLLYGVAAPLVHQQQPQPQGVHLALDKPPFFSCKSRAPAQPSQSPAPTPGVSQLPWLLMLSSNLQQANLHRTGLSGSETLVPHQTLMPPSISSGSSGHKEEACRKSFFKLGQGQGALNGHFYLSFWV